MQKNSNYSQRIDKVLIDKGFTKKDGSPNYSRAEQELSFGASVFSKLGQRDDGVLSRENEANFLRTFHVNREWLHTGKGEPYNSGPPEREPEAEQWSTFRFGNFGPESEYRVVPKKILDDYDMFPKKETDNRSKVIDVVTDTMRELKDALIAKYEIIIAGNEQDIEQLKREIEDLRLQLKTKGA
jgi:hypothetical protein